MLTAFQIAACLLTPVGAPESEADRAAAELIRVFRHPESRGEELANSRRAMAALEALGAPAIPKLLQAILSGDSAADFCDMVLVKLPAPEVAAGVAERWSNASAAHRWKSAAFYSRYGADRMEKFALASLDDKDANVRRSAWLFAGRNAKSKVLTPARDRYFTALSGGGIHGYRWELLFVEPLFDAQREADILIGLLKPGSWVAKGTGRVPLACQERPEWPDGRDIVVEILGERGVKRAVPALLELLKEKGEGKAFLGDAILPRLGEFGDESAIPEMKRILVANPDGLSENAAKALAARSLWQLGDLAGRPYLGEHLKSNHWDERKFAAETIGRFGTKDDIALLAAVLDDRNPDVLRIACAGLERITGVQQRGGRTRSSEADAPLWKEWLKRMR